MEEPASVRYLERRGKQEQIGDYLKADVLRGADAPGDAGARERQDRIQRFKHLGT